jgi:hypothetical protein
VQQAALAELEARWKKSLADARQKLGETEQDLEAKLGQGAAAAERALQQAEARLTRHAEERLEARVGSVTQVGPVSSER